MTATTPAANAAQTDAIIAADAAKAAELLAKAGDNMAKAKQDMVQLAEIYGGQAADGERSLTDLAYTFGSACGSLDSPIGENQASEIYLGFVNGFNAKSGDDVDKMPADEKSAKVPISMFRTFGKIGPAQFGATLWGMTLRIRRELGDACTMSAYNALVKANREVAKLAKDCVASNVVERLRGELTDALVEG